MTPPPTPIPPPQLESRLGALLGGGTWLACAIMAAGLCARLLGFEALGDHITTAGVGLIIALPMLRLTTMLDYFFRRREPKLAAITAAVLLIVAIGVILGLATRS